MRVRTVGGRGCLTGKGLTVGSTRVEYEMPKADADEIRVAPCEQPIIENVRYRIPLDGLVREIDGFEGATVA